MIQFTVYGTPVAQPRQRQRVIIPKNGKPFATNYTPASDPVTAWKVYVREEARKAGAAIIIGPVKFDASFYLPRPQSLMRAKDPPGPIPHPASRDVDNLYKAVADCLAGICYQNDMQIADARIRKFYHGKFSGPYAEITIEELLPNG